MLTALLAKRETNVVSVDMIATGGFQAAIGCHKRGPPLAEQCPRVS